MRLTAAFVLSLLVAVPAMALAAAQKKTAAPAAQKAAPAAKRVAPAKKDAPAKKAAAQPATKTAAAKKAEGGRARGPTRAKAAGGRKAAPPPAAPKADPAVIAAYAAMPVAERRALQSDLIWTGDYTGIISDDFGERSINAVKSYQERSGGTQTGLLGPQPRAAFATAAKAKPAAAGGRGLARGGARARLGAPSW